MNKEVKDYIDGIVIPSDIAVKRIKTGEYVREICENIERAAKEIYGITAIHEDDISCVESTQIYFIPCVDNTLTTGGYFCCVYLYMEDDFLDADCYETKVQIMFSEMEPQVNEHHDYEIWEGPESTFNITVGPDGFDVCYKPLKDPEKYPMMTADHEKITAFMKIVNDRTWKNPNPLDMMKVFSENPKQFGGAFCATAKLIEECKAGEET
jgi:hypothetical protein